jgi:hypothetical protein
MRELLVECLNEMADANHNDEASRTIRSYLIGHTKTNRDDPFDDAIRDLDKLINMAVELRGKMNRRIQ